MKASGISMGRARGGADAVLTSRSVGKVSGREQRGQLPNCTMQWRQMYAPHVCMYVAGPPQPAQRAPGGAGESESAVTVLLAGAGGYSGMASGAPPIAGAAG